MKFRIAIAAFFAATLACSHAFGQATILPPGETCFQATTGINGMVGALGTITGGTGGTSGTYGGVALTGGSGSQATANITVSGGAVTSVSILNPGVQYVVGDVLSAASGNIGGVSGFSFPVNSVAINSSLAGGSVAFYIPNTSTPKQTWQNSTETILNSNPVPLDANGCMVAYGSGVYRMVVQDSLSNTVYDKLTAATNGSNGIFWAFQAGGTGNAITVTDTAFALQDGYNLQFLALANNSGPTTITVSAVGPIAIVKDTSTGPAALSGGEIGAANTPMLTYDATNAEFHLVNPAATSSSSSTGSALTPPQGYLNLVGQASGDVIQTADVISATTVYYSPFVGNTIPIWNGSIFKQIVFSELTATLTSAGSPLSTIQDACVFSNNGVPTLVIGPAWTTATAGAGNRGTGASSAQITRLQGIWVNAVSMVGYNGLSSYSIPANQCTIAGSLSIDGTAGQVSAYRTVGQSRKFGVSNIYNQQNITLQVTDPSTSWAGTNTGTIQPSHASALNVLSLFQSLPEQVPTCGFTQSGQLSLTSGTGDSNEILIGIGYNSTTAFSGKSGILQQSNGNTNATAANNDMTAVYIPPPALGINNVTALEENVVNGNGNTFFGTSGMRLTCSWRG